MRFIYSLIVCSVFLLNKGIASSNYRLDEKGIESVFSKSESINNDLLKFSFNENNAYSSPTINTKEDLNKHTVAAIVATASFLLVVGVAIPIHRFILGMGKNGVKIFFAYFCTGSGCGVGLVLDAIFLWINMDNNKYENCERIIMWND
jgi:hypothetical protein